MGLKIHLLLIIMDSSLNVVVCILLDILDSSRSSSVSTISEVANGSEARDTALNATSAESSSNKVCHLIFHLHHFSSNFFRFLTKVLEIQNFFCLFSFRNSVSNCFFIPNI